MNKEFDSVIAEQIAVTLGQVMEWDGRYRKWNPIFPFNSFLLFNNSYAESLINDEVSIVFPDGYTIERFRGILRLLKMLLVVKPRPHKL